MRAEVGAPVINVHRSTVGTFVALGVGATPGEGTWTARSTGRMSSVTTHEVPEGTPIAEESDA